MEADSRSPKPFAFVVIPFDERFDNVYGLAIKATCEAAGAYCERVDEQSFQGAILDRICNQIAKADFIVADLSERNPNVFYETGYAHALGKPVVLLTRAIDDVPFDLRHQNILAYHPDRLGDLIPNLRRHVDVCIERARSGETGGSPGIRVLLGEEAAAGSSVRFVPYSGNYSRAELRVTLLNDGPRAFLEGTYSLGLLVPDGVTERAASVDEYHLYQTHVGGGRKLLSLRRSPALLPGTGHSFDLTLFWDEAREGASAEGLVRLSLATGFHEYPIRLELGPRKGA